MNHTQVLIVGAGPVGLTLALELGQQGVACRVVDKRPAPGFLPKMERCNARTMEIYRRLGLAERIREAGLDNDIPMDVFICAVDITRPPLVHHEYPSVNALKERSAACRDGSEPAEPYQLISQYTLEPLLVEEARKTPGVEVEFDSELVSLDDHGDSVTAAVVSADGQLRRMGSDYLVGCDGAASTVRRELGIDLEGDSLLELRQALFYSEDLFDRIPIGRGRHYHVADDRSSFLIVQDDTRHFSLHATVESDEEMPRLFEEIVGMDVSYETLYVGKWRQRLMVAERYRQGRVLMAGDAVHLVIPTGGLGMNTGAGDASDLGWKLAAVLQGWGGEHLLDSYEAERRPIGIRNVAASRKAAEGRRAWRSLWEPEITDDTAEGQRVRTRLAERADLEQRWSNDLLGIEMGYRYVGSPLTCDEVGGPDPDSFRYVPTTWPGARLPNVWLRDGRALQDAVGREYTLLRVGEGKSVDTSAVERAYVDLGIPFSVLDVDSEDAASVFGCALVLVRPDLHVVWRGNGPPEEPVSVALRSAGHVGAKS